MMDRAVRMRTRLCTKEILSRYDRSFSNPWRRTETQSSFHRAEDLQHGRRSADNIQSFSSRICSSVSAPEDLSPGTLHHKRSALIFHLYLIWKLSVNRNGGGGAWPLPPPFEKIRWGIRGLSVPMSQFFLSSRSDGFLLRGKRFCAAAGREEAQRRRLSAAIESSYLKWSWFFSGRISEAFVGRAERWSRGPAVDYASEKKGTQLGFLITSNPSILLHILPYCCSCVKTEVTTANFRVFQYLSVTLVVGLERKERRIKASSRQESARISNTGSVLWSSFDIIRKIIMLFSQIISVFRWIPFLPYSCWFQFISACRDSTAAEMIHRT